MKKYQIIQKIIVGPLLTNQTQVVEQRHLDSFFVSLKRHIRSGRPTTINLDIKEFNVPEKPRNNIMTADGYNKAREAANADEVAK